MSAIIVQDVLEENWYFICYHMVSSTGSRISRGVVDRICGIHVDRY